ncbi:probable methyltransferase-like protein 15 homolog [Bradysia coprophila]|uniref:probable methyltransferase-like protein 15 homolog n=1 Tax=Bradysia coprophila TaxID=38358 RepID=UPI00187DA22D|nr:probable methyltransferase-like protein 15 homolog [Bradysia coprophila]
MARRLLPSMQRQLFPLLCRLKHNHNITANPINELHIPVMATEVIDYLKPEPGKIFIDMTFGAGGHTKRILDHSPNTTVITLDRDQESYELAMDMKDDYPNRLIPMLGKFSELPDLLKAHGYGFASIDGILFDFGCSSMQFDQADRGFALSKNGPLDMRMDKDRIPGQPTAADVLAKIDEEDLARILKIYGEEKCAKKIARAIVDTRYSLRKIETTKELADLVNSCFNDNLRLDKLQRHAHNATKTFLALRIFVNDELNEINYGMLLAERFLKQNGRLVAITFHSLEDLIVKRHLMGNLLGNVANPIPLRYSSHALVQELEVINELKESSWQQLNKHVLVPTTEEIERNPRSRSAKFRAAVKE